MIRIAGSYTFDTSPESIWPRIFDSESLMGLIPGCQAIEQVNADEYRGQIDIGLPAIVAGIRPPSGWSSMTNPNTVRSKAR